jgi:hypothetical protein
VRAQVVADHLVVCCDHRQHKLSVGTERVLLSLIVPHRSLHAVMCCFDKARSST